MNKLYAKLEDTDNITFFRNPLVYDGKKIFNPTEQQLLRAGYKNYEQAMIDHDQAELSDYVVSYTEDEFTIYQHYNYTLNPTKAMGVYTECAQDMMDNVVRDRNYDSIGSACSYFNSTNEKFANEGNTCIRYRDSVWLKCYELLNKVLAGEMEIPSKSDFLGMLPQFSWDMYDETDSPEDNTNNTDNPDNTNNTDETNATEETAVE